jgi:hypothetical protein
MFPHFSMAHPSTVPQRVERVLDARQDRRPPGLIRRSAFALAIAAAAFGCLTLTPGLAAPTERDAEVAERDCAKPGDTDPPVNRERPDPSEGESPSGAVCSTKVFRVPRDFLLRFTEAKPGRFQRPTAVDVLKQAGIDFPEPATAAYDQLTSTLTVHNTATNLELTSQFIDSIFDTVIKLLNLRVELYRMPKAHALEVLDGLDEVADATPIVTKLRRRMQDGEEVSLVSAPSIQTRSGQRARVRSGRGGSEDALKPVKPTSDSVVGAQPMTKDFQGTVFEVEATLGPGLG